MAIKQTLYKRQCRNAYFETSLKVKVRPVDNLVSEYHEHAKARQSYQQLASAQKVDSTIPTKTFRRTVHQLGYHREMFADCEAEAVMHVANFLLKKTKGAALDAKKLLVNMGGNKEVVEAAIDKWSSEGLQSIEEAIEQEKEKQLSEIIAGADVCKHLRIREMEITLEYRKRKRFEDVIAPWFHHNA